MDRHGLLDRHPGALHTRAAALSLILLAHVLMLVCAWQTEVGRRAVARALPQAERYFVEVAIPALARLPASEATEPAGATAVHGDASTALRAPALTAPASAAVNVELPPVRIEPPPVRIEPPPVRGEPPLRSEPPAAAAPGAPAAAPAEAHGARAPAPASPAPPQRAVSGIDDTPKVIEVVSIGSSKATYTFPALTGLDSDDKPRVFEVDIGSYEDIELAIVHHVIEQIRARYPNEVSWDSRIRNARVRLSMRKEDEAEVVKFLRIELFGPHKSTTY